MGFMSEVEIKDEKEMPEGAEPRIYELGYHFVPTLAEENLPATYTKLKELILSFGGEVISDEMPKLIPLAYTIKKLIANVWNKFDNAYFGWVKFYMDADKVLELKKKLDLDKEVVRFLILKTVKENTIAAKRFVGRDMPYRKAPTLHKPPENVEAVPINKEEIDKEIDAMIAV